MSQRIEDLIVGRSRVIVELRRTVLRVAPSRLSVLVEGPTGSGKEVVARALHACSGRRGAFVATNVSAISESIFENEVFGHRRGGFTGATTRHDGLLEQANGGTLFLDEIGGLGRAGQAKLLRAIETGEYRPVGGSRDERSHFRLVSATNEGLAGLVAGGSFRADLGFRVGAIRIGTPALDGRPEDIEPLVASFAAALGQPVNRVSADGVAELMLMEWPGSVRQLRHFVELLMELHLGVIDRTVVRDLAAERLHGEVRPEEGSGEREKLLALLERHDWRKEAAAAERGVHVTTLYRQMQRLRISARAVQVR